jgi:hypothetical protein
MLRYKMDAKSQATAADTMRNAAATNRRSS